MGKSSPSAPPPPDYAGAAVAQGQANVDTARVQGQMNNPNIVGPLGGQTVTWSGDQPTVTQTLTPAAQATLDAQQRVQRALAGLGEQGIGTAQGVLSNAFNPNLAGLQTNVGNAGQIPQTPNLSRYGQASGLQRAAGFPSQDRILSDGSGVSGFNQPPPGLNGGRSTGFPSQDRIMQDGSGVLGVNQQPTPQTPNNTGNLGNDVMQNPQGPQMGGPVSDGAGGIAYASDFGNGGRPNPQTGNLGNDVMQNPEVTAKFAALRAAGMGPQPSNQPSGNSGQLPRAPELSAYGMAGAGPQAGQYGYAQGGLNTSNVAAMPVNAGMTGQQAIMNRLAPQLELSDAQTRQRLANQGLVPGGEAYENAMISQNQQKNDLLSQAALQGIGLDTAANAQGFGQAVQANQIGNQAIGQNFGQGQTANAAQNAAIGQNQQAALAQYQAQLGGQQQGFGQNVTQRQLGNQAISQNQQAALQQQQAALAAQNQQYNQLLQGAQFGNTAQQQSLAQQLALRNQPLNEISGLMAGSQIQMPQFQGYQGSNIAPAPVFAGAQAAGQSAMDQYGIASSNVNAQNAGLYGLLGAGGAAGIMKYSDPRLKSNVVRVGTHRLGIGVYEYDIFGNRERGVMADEVEAVMPEAVALHPSGYKMVNYGMIN